MTKQINQFYGTTNMRVWQRNYHEHIIRNETAYLKIAEYIQTNPLRWSEDRYYENSTAESATQLASLGGVAPDLQPIPRRQSPL